MYTSISMCEWTFFGIFMVAIIYACMWPCQFYVFVRPADAKCNLSKSSPLWFLQTHLPAPPTTTTTRTHTYHKYLSGWMLGGGLTYVPSEMSTCCWQSIKPLCLGCKTLLRVLFNLLALHEHGCPECVLTQDQFVHPGVSHAWENHKPILSVVDAEWHCNLSKSNTLSDIQYTHNVRLL